MSVADLRAQLSRVNTSIATLQADIASRRGGDSGVRQNQRALTFQFQRKASLESQIANLQQQQQEGEREAERQRYRSEFDTVLKQLEKVYGRKFDYTGLTPEQQKYMDIAKQNLMTQQQKEGQKLRSMLGAGGMGFGGGTTRALSELQGQQLGQLQQQELGYRGQAQQEAYQRWLNELQRQASPITAKLQDISQQGGLAQQSLIAQTQRQFQERMAQQQQQAQNYQNMLNMQLQAEQQRQAQPSTFEKILGGIGAVAPLLAAPLTGGTSLLGYGVQGLGSLFGGGRQPYQQPMPQVPWM